MVATANGSVDSPVALVAIVSAATTLLRLSFMTTAVTQIDSPSAMPLITILTGVAEIGLGVGLSLIAIHDGMTWKTAAIPAYVGVVFVVLGALAMVPHLRKQLVRASAALAAVLALSGIGMGLPKIVMHAAGKLPPTTAVRPVAWWGQVSMALIFVVFLGFAIHSFIIAKRSRNERSM